MRIFYFEFSGAYLGVIFHPTDRTILSVTEIYHKPGNVICSNLLTEL